MPCKAKISWRVALMAGSVLLFGAALSRTAFFWGQSAASSGPGWRLLLQGWRGVSGGYVEWLANPALLTSWVATAYGRRRLAITSACSAVALMLVFLFRRSLEIPVLAAGATVFSYGAGYWLWLGSALLMVVANLCRCIQDSGPSAFYGKGARPPPDSKDSP